MVNLVLKDHAHRPRPVHVREFWRATRTSARCLRFDGTCPRNCSFVSGEGSAAFWTLAPALLAPAPVRVAAIAAALVYGVARACCALAFGGHFLSDTILAAWWTWLVIVLCWRGIVVSRGRAPGAMPDEPSHDAQDRR